MKNLLQQPFPHATDTRSRLLTAGGFGMFIFVFLLTFRPFEMDLLPMAVVLKSSFVFGLATFTCILATNYLIEKIFPAVFTEEKWTTGKQIVNMAVVVLVVGIVNYLLFPLLFRMPLNWSNFFRAQLITVSVGLIPIVIYTLYQQNRWLTRFKEEAALLQVKLEAKQEEHELPSAPGPATVTIPGESDREKITLSTGELVYIESASNYVKIFFEHKGKLSFTILRTTLKKVEETMRDHPFLFRCHRAYIINLDRIEKVEGNAQGYKLKMKGTGERIPVSRAMNREFSDRLLAIRNAFHIYPAEK
jgi:hypothetical protein